MNLALAAGVVAGLAGHRRPVWDRTARAGLKPDAPPPYPASADRGIERKVKRTHSSFRPVALAGDLVVALAALYGAYLLRIHVPMPGTEQLLPRENVTFGLWNVGLVAAVQVFSLSSLGLYGEHERFREPLVRLVIPALFLELATLASVYFLAPAYSFPRSLLVVYLAVNGLASHPLEGVARPAVPAAAAARPHRRKRSGGGSDRRDGSPAPLERGRDRGRGGGGGRSRWSFRRRTGRRCAAPIPRSDRKARGDRGERERGRGDPDARRAVVEGPPLGADPGGLARGPSRLAVPLRDHDRAPALPDRRRPAASRSARGSRCARSALS